MADAHKEKGTSIVPRIHELLLKVHQELFKGREGAHPAHWTHCLDMGETPRRRFQGIEMLYG